MGAPLGRASYKEQTFAPRVFHSVSVRALTERDKQTQAVRNAQKLAQNVFPPWWPTLTSRSLQSLTRPFQKRFREVFGNARILIFYLSIKAGEEKSLPKSHLGWFFLVFGEGKTTKENMSIFLVHLTFKVARYSFSESIPPKFEHKLRRHAQIFGNWNRHHTCIR